MTADPVAYDEEPQPDADPTAADLAVLAWLDDADPGPDEAGGWPAGPGSTVNLTMPAASWLGQSDTPGDIGGHGAADAATCRDLADALTTQPGTRWCVTLLDPNGQAVAHGCARTRPPSTGPPRTRPPGTRPPGTGPPGTGPPGTRPPGTRPPGTRPPGTRPPGTGPPGTGDAAAWLASITITPIETGTCTHRRESAGYRPSDTLRHIIKIRSRRCGFPGCRRRAIRCDDDHTIPYHQGGRTCECNLHPLCRQHHQTKQAPGWHLTQPEPGTLIWTTPNGRKYTVNPEPYPV